MNDKIIYTENWMGMQGEGRYVGCPSIFLRFFGCNFRCPKFNNGTVVGKRNSEVAEIIANLQSYKTNQDLPLVTTGCDSYMSVYPEFKHMAHSVTVDEMAANIVKLLPGNKWDDVHFVITGGEPLLLARQIDSLNLLSHKDITPKFVTFETNGSMGLCDAFVRFMKEASFDLTFSVSPKLSNSGEPKEKTFKPYVIRQYQSVGFTYLKFVVSNDADVQEVLSLVDDYRENDFDGPIYLMPTGGTSEVYEKNRVLVANLAIEHGLRYSPRLHVDLWGNEWST